LHAVVNTDAEIRNRWLGIRWEKKICRWECR